jgi:hypothetical protein
MNATQLLSTAVLAVASLPVLLAPQSASATSAGGIQITRYMGAACHAVDADNAQRVRRDSSGRLLNTSTTDFLLVECALTRDAFSGSHARVQVYAIDQKAQAGKSVICNFNAVDPTIVFAGAKSQFSTGAVASGLNSPQKISSETLAVGSNMMQLRCILPPADAAGSKRSGIAAVEVFESL